MTKTAGKRFVQWWRRRWQMLTRKRLRHAVGRYTIELPAEHRLPELQAAHPRYDRFLQHLTAQLNAWDVVIDVGANCGDTLAALLLGKQALEVVCIEPDAGFFAYLERNAEHLRVAAAPARMQLVQALVGQSVGQATLHGGGGTRRAKVAPPGSGIAARRLDDIVSALPGEVAARVRLVKCDVEGWDCDVIGSAPALLRGVHPMLFFACQTDAEAQRQTYVRTLQALLERGYAQVFVFDNFGGLMVRCDALPALQTLIDYLWQQHQGQATRTVYQLDFLVCSQADVVLVERALQAYHA